MLRVDLDNFALGLLLHFNCYEKINDMCHIEFDITRLLYSFQNIIF